jgi:hypothetical protein
MSWVRTHLTKLLLRAKIPQKRSELDPGLFLELINAIGSMDKARALVETVRSLFDGGGSPVHRPGKPK